MDNIKVNLSILLPGRTMLSVEESTRIATNGSRAIDTHKHDKFEIEVGNGRNKETVKVFTRKCRRAKQVMHLTEEAYEYMTSPREIPYQYKGIWRKLTDKERLSWHCARIAESLGGTVESIQVLS